MIIKHKRRHNIIPTSLTIIYKQDFVKKEIKSKQWPLSCPIYKSRVIIENDYFDLATLKAAFRPPWFYRRGNGTGIPNNSVIIEDDSIWLRALSKSS